MRREPVVLDQIPQEATDERAGDPEQYRAEYPDRVAAWDEQPGDGSGDQPDDDKDHDVREHGRLTTAIRADYSGSAASGPDRAGAVSHLLPAMPTRSYILVVNGRKVRQPVFVIGAPHSGADLIARALKRSAGFHFTIGQPSVLSVVYAFARTPSIQQGRGEAAATVLSDAFAQAWQVTPEACLTCHTECQQAKAARRPGICVD